MIERISPEVISLRVIALDSRWQGSGGFSGGACDGKRERPGEAEDREVTFHHIRTCLKKR